MQKISIIGLGEVLHGDYGAACYVLEAVAEEIVGESVQIAYLGDDPRFAGGLLYRADLAIVVGTLCLTGVPGGLHVWNGNVFRQHAAWMVDENTAIGRLMGVLARADLADGLPRKLICIWIEPEVLEGCTISRSVRRSVAMAVRRIRREVIALGLRREDSSTVALSHIHGP